MSKRLRLKIILVGDAKVGKTSLMNQFVNQKFSSMYKYTLGADFRTKDISIDDKNIPMQIWDITGNEQYKSFGVPYYRGADCCVFCYDVNDPKTFESFNSRREEFLAEASPTNPDQFPFVVIGNKADCNENVNEDEKKKVEEWCAAKKYPFFECSAKTGFNVENAFMEIAKLVLTHSEN